MDETRATQATPYELIGGDGAVRALVDAFYDRMDLEEAFAGIRATCRFRSPQASATSGSRACEWRWTT
jgi:truncated hemoglobin YjbI